MKFQNQNNFFLSHWKVSIDVIHFLHFRNIYLFSHRIPKQIWFTLLIKLFARFFSVNINAIIVTFWRYVDTFRQFIVTFSLRSWLFVAFVKICRIRTGAVIQCTKWGFWTRAGVRFAVLCTIISFCWCIAARRWNKMDRIWSTAIS